MTVIKSTHNLRNILDFSGRRYPKSQIKKVLRSLKLRIIEYPEDGSRCYVINQIKVGMYIIRLITNPQEGDLGLKDLDLLVINIYEEKGKLPINLEQDGRFKQQYWIQHNISSTFRAKHLVDAISHCQRLDGLKAFL